LVAALGSGAQPTPREGVEIIDPRHDGREGHGAPSSGAVEPDSGATLPDGVPGRFIDVGGRRVHIVEQGSGRPLLLVHGTAGTTLDWESSVLDDFARDHRVIAVDLFGMGFSSRLGSRFTFEVWTRQLADTLAVLGIEHATLIGQSLGGAVVTSFAGDHPRLADRVVSVDSGPWINPAMIPMLSARYVDRLVNRRGYWPDRPEQGSAYATRLRDVYRIEGTRDDLAAIVRGQFLDGRNYFRSIAATRCPTLLIHGGADRIIPIRAARSLLKRIPGSELVVIEGAGHFAMQDAPARFVEECNRFFARTGVT